MKHLPWNTYLVMSGKQSHQISPDDQLAINGALTAQQQARRDPNGAYWQEQVASCRKSLAYAFPEHMAALDAALPGLFTPQSGETYQALAGRLTPIVRRIYSSYQTAADLVAAFSLREQCLA